MIVEMHCHTAEHSACSIVSARDLVRKAFQSGIQLIVFTDHHYKWNDEELEALHKEAGLPETFRILSGQEVTTKDFGDVLVYGAAKTYNKQSILLAELRDQDPDAGIIWAHPYRNGKIPHKSQLTSRLIDGIEVFNSNYSIGESGKALKDYRAHRLTGIGGTDTHAYSYTGSYPTIFDNRIETIHELVSEIKAGRCRPLIKEVERSGTSNTKVTELTIGSEESGSAKKLIVKSFANDESWKEGERSFRIVRELTKHGFDKGQYRIPEPLDKDETTLSLIEEHIDGNSLFDSIIRAEPYEGSKYLGMAARWLSVLHNLRLQISPPDEYIQIEPARTEYYLKSLVLTKNKFLERVREIKEMVLALETELISKRPEILVQGHGDYHLKNIFINKDEKDEYVAAIDFDSSFLLPRAFDVGSFLAQYDNMFFNNREIQLSTPSDIFLETYIANAEALEDDFIDQVHLFKSRASLSILYYLAKVNLGESENFFRIMVGAERNLSVIL